MLICWLSWVCKSPQMPVAVEAGGQRRLFIADAFTLPSHAAEGRCLTSLTSALDRNGQQC